MAGTELNSFLRRLRSVLQRQEGADTPDADLLRRYAGQGDEAAFEALVQRYGPMVLGVCQRILANPHDAEDAFQATFLVLVSKAATLRLHSTLGNWLYGVACRTAKHARHAAIKRRAKETAMLARSEKSEDAWAELLPLLDLELERLPDKYRSAIVLCELQGKPRREAAQLLGCPEGTVASRLSRGLALLAKRLAGHGPAVTSAALVTVLSERATASVPVAMVSSTIEAATLFAAGQAAATGAISVQVAALTQGVLKTMLVSKLKVAAVVLLAMVAVGVGSGGIMYRICAAEQPRTAKSVARESQAKSDRNRKPKNAPVLTDEVKAARVQVDAARARVEIAKSQLELAKAMLRVSEAELSAAEANQKRPAGRPIRPQLRSIAKTIGQPGFVEAYERSSIYSRVTGCIEKWNVDIGDKVKKGDVLAIISATDLREELESKKATVKLAHLQLERARKAVERIQADAKAAESRRAAAKAESELAVKVAEAELAVAESDAKRLAIRVGYLTLTAPYDGIIVARNANTSDFVSPDSKAPPIYVIDRQDIVRVFVDIPEGEANYVRVGTKARVQIRGYRDEWIPAAVTRTSWALDVKSRTLRAEIDLANLGTELLPGMYAYGKVIVERPRVWTLPLSALERIGDKTFYWGTAQGRAVRTEIQTGVSDGEWIEVVKRRSPGAGENDRWEPIDGSEQVVPADPSSQTKP